MHARIGNQERINALGLVRREVVCDDVDFFVRRLVQDDIGQECHELGNGVVLSGFHENLSGLGVEGGVRRNRAVAETLKAVSLRASRGERQHWVLSIKRLNRCFLIDAEDGRMLRGSQVEANDVAALASKSGSLERCSLRDDAA